MGSVCEVVVPPPVSGESSPLQPDSVHATIRPNKTNQTIVRLALLISVTSNKSVISYYEAVTSGLPRHTRNRLDPNQRSPFGEAMPSSPASTTTDV